MKGSHRDQIMLLPCCIVTHMDVNDLIRHLSDVPLRFHSFIFYRSGKIVFQSFKTTWSVISLVFHDTKFSVNSQIKWEQIIILMTPNSFRERFMKSPSHPHSGLEWICLCPVQITVMKICFLNNIDWINLYNGFIFLNKMSTALYSVVFSGYHFR